MADEDDGSNLKEKVSKARTKKTTQLDEGVVVNKNDAVNPHSKDYKPEFGSQHSGAINVHGEE